MNIENAFSEAKTILNKSHKVLSSNSWLETSKTFPYLESVLNEVISDIRAGKIDKDSLSISTPTYSSVIGGVDMTFDFSDKPLLSTHCVTKLTSFFEHKNGSSGNLELSIEIDLTSDMTQRVDTSYSFNISFYNESNRVTLLNSTNASIEDNLNSFFLSFDHSFISDFFFNDFSKLKKEESIYLKAFKSEILK